MQNQDQKLQAQARYNFRNQYAAMARRTAKIRWLDRALLAGAALDVVTAVAIVAVAVAVPALLTTVLLPATAVFGLCSLVLMNGMKLSDRLTRSTAEKMLNADAANGKLLQRQLAAEQFARDVVFGNFDARKDFTAAAAPQYKPEPKTPLFNRFFAPRLAFA